MSLSERLSCCQCWRQQAAWVQGSSTFKLISNDVTSHLLHFTDPTERKHVYVINHATQHPSLAVGMTAYSCCQHISPGAE